MSAGGPHDSARYHPRAPGVLAAAWGAGGFALLLSFAILRLGLVASAGLAVDWQWPHGLALLVSIGGMAYFEGYRAFQLAYAPRFAARAAYLLREPTPLRLMLAPLFCMSFFHAPRRRRVSALFLTSLIVLLVTAVRALPQPWRAIVDAGVVVGLAWGLVATVLACAHALRAGAPAVDPEIA